MKCEEVADCPYISSLLSTVCTFICHMRRAVEEEKPNDGNKMFHSRNKTIPAHCQNKLETHFTVSFSASSRVTDELSKKAQARSAAPDTEGALLLPSAQSLTAVHCA
jgi:hypothetical protein